MRTDIDGQMLRIYVGEADTFHGRPVYEQIVERARKAGLAGVTVIRGIYGYGAGSHPHTARVRRVREDTPVVIEIADNPDRLAAFIPLADELVRGGLITLEGAELISYRTSK